MLLTMNMKHKSLGGGDPTIAKQTLEKMKKTLSLKARKIMTVLEEHQSDSEKTAKEMNIRNFKNCLETIFNVSSYEAENLIQFLDPMSEGFIKTVDIQSKFV